MKVAWLLTLLFAAACSQKPIGEPAGSNNFDDPDDPSSPGAGSGGPDASGDAYGRPCVGARDCPAAFVCAYSIASACSAAGECLPYAGVSATECDAGTACGCDNTNVLLCAPAGYAPKPVQSSSACGTQTDAGTDQ